MASRDEAPKLSSSVKLVLLGEAAVGKSSLVLRFVNDDFQENKEPTIGAAFLTQRCTLPSRTIKFEIWDTAGQERFASLAPMYYRNAQTALVVYDITKPTSLTKAKHWVSELQRQASPGIVIALVGNKLDLAATTAGDGRCSRRKRGLMRMRRDCYSTRRPLRLGRMCRNTLRPRGGAGGLGGSGRGGGAGAGGGAGGEGGVGMAVSLEDGARAKEGCAC
ncbi:unnamed protein product [Tuber melanosporum]|uniref:(Perigord truffle) hypothetical protein n=1 Tax=Tuber melanosporum (strain Mel28) TaxID=656061 RepID=D5GBJ1_TUBMM|nr:uncharacterized protein GSTUM_00005657001 [Tuber melanosporum]CAZ81997.1 unnamed protein product [Tuber melanosporum]